MQPVQPLGRDRLPHHVFLSVLLLPVRRGSGMNIAYKSGRQFLPSTRGRVRWVRKSANAVLSTFVFPRWRRREKLRYDVSYVVLFMAV